MGGKSASAACALVLALLLMPAEASAQRIAKLENIGPLAARLDPQPDERMVLCEIEPLRPTLSFGFRFEAGYVFRLPPKLYRDQGHRWTVLTRVKSEDSGAEAVYLVSTGRFPPANRQTNKGRAEARGAFWVGEGRYSVKWALVDDQGRVCRKQWHMEASLGRSERKIKLAVPPGAVAEPSWKGFEDVDPPANGNVPARLTVFLDAAPRRVRRNSQANLNPSDQLQLLGALSELLEDIPSPAVRLVVFSLEQQNELFRREDFHLRDLGQVADALNRLTLGSVDSQVLRDPGGRVRLVTALINGELRETQQSDLVIVLGPEERYDDRVPAEALEKTGSESPRFFYVQYKPAPRIALVQPFDLGKAPGFNDQAPVVLTDPGTGNSSDLIRSAIKRVQGEIFTIYTPGQFAKAVDRIQREVAAR